MKQWILLLALCGLLGGSAQADLLCGDIDLSGTTDIADIVYLVDYMFTGGPPLPFPPTADCDGGGGDIDISTLVCWVDCWFIFEGGCTPQCAFEELDNHTEIGGPCLDSAGAYDGPASERGMYIEAVGNDLHVYHPGAYYQCCLGYYVQYYQYGNHFIGYETDVNELCDCYCPFDLESTIHNLVAGEYVVTLYDIEGDLLGVDTAVIEAGVIDFNIGECVQDPKGPPETGDPIVNYYWSNGILTMVHENAFFNCGAIFALEFEMVGDTLRFHEINTNEMMPVPCMCYYELTSVIQGIPPGSYVAEVYNQDYPWVEDLLLDRQHISVGQGGPVLLDFGDSGCLGEGDKSVLSSVSYSYSGDTLTMEDLGAIFNCGGIIDVEFSIAGDTLRFYELNISEDYAFCNCPFDITARLTDVVPGTYIAEVYARDLPDDPILLTDRQTLVLE